MVFPVENGFLKIRYFTADEGKQNACLKKYFQTGILFWIKKLIKYMWLVFILL